LAARGKEFRHSSAWTEQISLGHELIHALHNARVENPNAGAGVFGAVRNPVTNESESPEDLRTISGQCSYALPREGRLGANQWPTSFKVSSHGNITENMLRSERGLEDRVSHAGSSLVAVQVPAGETLEQLVARHYLEGGQALPPGFGNLLEELLLQFNTGLRGTSGRTGVDDRALPISRSH